MANHGLGRNASKAFTLVELLVVIGIICILIGILLSVLSRAREHANALKCMANLRSQGQAMTIYTQTSGYYPGLRAPGGPVWTAVWPARLRAVMGGNRDVFLCPSRDPERFAWTDQLGTIPANSEFAPYGYKLGEKMITNVIPFSYGYNGVNMVGLGSTVGPGSPPPPYREVRANRVKMPADMVAIADTQGDGLEDPCIFVGRRIGHDASPADPGVGAIHRGGANVLFCDGHVQWYHLNDITVPIDGSVSFTQLPWRDIMARWDINHAYPQ